MYANQVVAAAAIGLDGTATYTAWHPFQVAWIVGCLPGMADPGRAPRRQHRLVRHRRREVRGLPGPDGRDPVLRPAHRRAPPAPRCGPGSRCGCSRSSRPNGSPAWSSTPSCCGDSSTPGDLPPVTRSASGTSSAAETPRTSCSTRARLYSPGWTRTHAETAEACRVLDVCPLCGHAPEVSLRRRQLDDAAHLPHRRLPDGRHPAGVGRRRRHLPQRARGPGRHRRQARPARPADATSRSCSAGPCPAAPSTATPARPSGAPSSAASTTAPADRRTGSAHVRLEIADELHLLEECLGALDGMYETLLQAICAPGWATSRCRSSARPRPSRATRTRSTTCTSGPPAGSRSTGRTSARRSGRRPSDVDPLRRFLGVQPRRITMVTATREVALPTPRGWPTCCDDPDRGPHRSGPGPGRPRRTWTRLAGPPPDLYEVLVAYCLRNEDLSHSPVTTTYRTC